MKTDLELLEENRDQARSMVLALEAQIDLTQGRILTMIKPEEEKNRADREIQLHKLKAEQKAHNMIVEQFDRMIERLKHDPMDRSNR